MNPLANRLSRIEARWKPKGAVLVVEYWDSDDDPKLAQAEQQAGEQGGYVVVIQKFCPRPQVPQSITCSSGYPYFQLLRGGNLEEHIADAEREASNRGE